MQRAGESLGNVGNDDNNENPIKPINPVVPVTYTITYDGNQKTGGAVPVDSTKYNAGMEVTVRGNTGYLVKTGYTFAGWNTDSKGTGSTYTAGDDFTILANTTLYAQWLMDSHGIILSINEDNITSKTHTFPDAVFGYSTQTAQTVKITNTGNQPTGDLTITLYNSSSFTLSSSSINSIVVNGSDTFTIVPNNDLSTEKHSNVITVTGNGGIMASFIVIFTVTPLSITTAAVSVTAPAQGAVPSSTASGTGNFSVYNVTWDPSHNPFQGTTQYTASVTLTANTNYTFTGLTDATINGQTADVVSSYGWQVTLSYKFPATEKTPITTAAINVTTPVRGEYASYSIRTEGYGYTYDYGSLTWNPAGYQQWQFQAGIQYTVQVTLTAYTYCTFTGLTEATVNGQTADVSNNTGTQVTLSYSFPATDHSPNIIWYITNPMGPNFTISNAAELEVLAQIVNEVFVNGYYHRYGDGRNDGYDGLTDDFNGKTITLANDIDLSTYIWTSIGDNYFKGTFDGNGNKITNIFSSSGGLFGDMHGTVKNLGIENITQDGYEAGYIGGMVNVNYGMVTNCYFTGTVSGRGGGVVGYNGGTVTNCYSSGTGVVGYNYGTVTNCYSTGTGVVGYNDGTVTNCYSTGTVSGSNVGGVVSENLGTVTNCYSTATVSGSNSVGGVVGDNGGTVSNCYSRGTVNISFYLTAASVGGVLGLSGDYTLFQNEYRVENCVALNNMVVTPLTGIGVGRVIGNYYLAVNKRNFQNNYGRQTMTTDGVFISGSGTTHVNGADITSTQWNSASWWIETAGFSTSEWNISNNSLPTLKNMPDGTQNPVVLMQ